jgi:hypothetical protein
MAYRLITCPATATLELIEYEQDPLGVLVLACSRFRPPSCMSCPRGCAASIDGRAQPAPAFADDPPIDLEPEGIEPETIDLDVEPTEVALDPTELEPTELDFAITRSRRAVIR